MKEKWNYFLYLLWFSYVVLSAVLMFGRGFLLSRKTLSDVSECVQISAFGCDGKQATDGSISSCSEDEKMLKILSDPNSPLVCTHSKNRVIVLLVDALRYDFTEYDSRILKELPYQNKLPIISKLLKEQPEQSRLYQFIADPPTTTLQRLKALMTGSLPTFIDMSSNFAASELLEDNFVDQVVKTGANIVLLGDDTWSHLLPGRWLRSHAMYSFHTWDLDTVDREVDKNIYNEMATKDWQLIVAHYLGVDHAGHRYGPNHPEMARKLRELNSRLEKIVAEMPPDATLFVIGDHGMTETGDHGGESKIERTAAFFAYRNLSFGAIDTPGTEVQQMDFATTLSAVFGRPPPAPSIGNIVLPVVPNVTIPNSLLLMSNNLKQILTYLIRYGEESQQIPIEKMANLINATRECINNIKTVRTSKDLKVFRNHVRSVVDLTRDTFRDVWIEFDAVSMVRGLLLIFLTVFFNWLLVEGVPSEQISNIFSSSFVPSMLSSVFGCTLLCYTLYYFNFIVYVEHAIILSTGLVSNLMLCSVIILHWEGISQRWYDSRHQYTERIARGLLLGSAIILVSNSYIIEEGATLAFLIMTILALRAWNIRSIDALLLWVSCGVVLALTRSYRGCREEQGDCWLQQKDKLTHKQPKVLVAALSCVIISITFIRRHLGWRSHGITAAGAVVAAHWCVSFEGIGAPAPAKMIARFCWTLLGLLALQVFFKDGGGPKLSIMLVSCIVYLGNLLVLGVIMSPTGTLALLSGVIVLNLIKMSNNDWNSKFSLSTRCQSSAACLWALLAIYQFYATGHHPTFGHIRWAPAFHAGDPGELEMGTFIMGALVCLELFGMQLLFGVATPLLALCGTNATVSPKTQSTAVFLINLKFALCFAVRLFVCMFAATIHCRHLMIWGVFTPKLIFETGSCAAALLGTLIGAIISVWHMPVLKKK